MPDPIRFGPEFDIAAVITNVQDAATTTRLPDGRVVVVWRDLGVNSGDIKYRIMNADGSPARPEMTANATTAGGQGVPRVAGLADGSFVIVWESFASDGNGDVVFRRFDGAGVPLDAADLSATTNPAGYQQDPTIVARPDGSFVIGWNEGNPAVSGLGSSTAAVVRSFGADGVATTGVLRVSGNFGGDFAPQLAATGDALIMVWDDDGGPSLTVSGDGIYSRTILGSLPNSPFTDGGQRVDDGTFRESSRNPSIAYSLVLGQVVVWDDDFAGTDSRDIYVNINGIGPVRVNTTTANAQSNAQVAVLSDGGFVVVWYDAGSGLGDIRARIYNGLGQPTGNDFVVTSAGAASVGAQTAPDVEALIDGRFMVTWAEDVTLGIRGVIFDPRTTVVSWTGGSAGEQFYGTSNLEGDTLSGAGGNDLLFGQAGSDLIYGGTGNDSLNGGTEGDNLWGGTGVDAHDGGAGLDYARYDDANYGNLLIRLDNPASNTGAAAGDTYSGIEGLVGGAGNDSIYGDGSNNYLFGSGGADQVFGGAGNDYLSGDAGGDNLWGGAGADAHYGGTDAGVDYARYDEANHGNLVISLLTPATNTGAAAGDTYSGIEGLVGGAGNDTITGDALANTLFGGGGNDMVYGGAANDLLFGVAGADNLWGGAGADQHYGGTDAGVDYARYDDANHGNLTISLLAGVAGTGAAAGDTFSGIEGLVGGAGADVVIGDAAGNFLFGSGGNDFIDGLAGNDYLNGGAGADRFRLSTAAGAGNIDTVADFQVGVDDILLANAIFAAIGGSLTADEFRIGAAVDGNDFILYNSATGALTYDTNGSTAGGATQIATLSTGMNTLSIADFVMV